MPFGDKKWRFGAAGAVRKPSSAVLRHILPFWSRFYRSETVRVRFATDFTVFARILPFGSRPGPFRGRFYRFHAHFTVRKPSGSVLRRILPFFSVSERVRRERREIPANLKNIF
jgi:hypothetical protein